jgi:TetR/AcrR family tetracycline transcriptional repressor
MAEEICRDIQRPDSSDFWEEQVRSVAHAYRNRLRTIRDSAAILLATAPVTPERLAIVERMLALFSEAGFRGREILLAASMINDYVVSFALNEAYQQEEQAAADPGAVFEHLPAEEFPYIRALAEHMLMDDLDTHFQYGLDVILSGLRSRLSPRGASGGDGTS